MHKKLSAHASSMYDNYDQCSFETLYNLFLRALRSFILQYKSLKGNLSHHISFYKNYLYFYLIKCGSKVSKRRRVFVELACERDARI